MGRGRPLLSYHTSCTGFLQAFSFLCQRVPPQLQLHPARPAVRCSSPVQSGKTSNVFRMQAMYIRAACTLGLRQAAHGRTVGNASPMRTLVCATTTAVVGGGCVRARRQRIRPDTRTEMRIFFNRHRIYMVFDATSRTAVPGTVPYGTAVSIPPMTRIISAVPCTTTLLYKAPTTAV